MVRIPRVAFSREDSCGKELPSRLFTRPLPSLLTGRKHPSPQETKSDKGSAFLDGAENSGESDAEIARRSRCLSRHQIEEYVEALSGLAVSERYHAAEKLATLGPNAKNAIPELRNVLRHDDSALVRKSAALALGEIGVVSGHVVPALRDAAESDSDKFVRERAAQALRRLGIKMIVAL